MKPFLKFVMFQNFTQVTAKFTMQKFTFQNSDEKYLTVWNISFNLKFLNRHEVLYKVVSEGGNLHLLSI